MLQILRFTVYLLFKFVFQYSFVVLFVVCWLLVFLVMYLLHYFYEFLLTDGVGDESKSNLCKSA